MRYCAESSTRVNGHRGTHIITRNDLRLSPLKKFVTPVVSLWSDMALIFDLSFLMGVAKVAHMGHRPYDAYGLLNLYLQGLCF
jgi:hypothetical protein